MKRCSLVLLPLFAFTLLIGSDTGLNTIPINMKYLGEVPPGNSPVRFAASVLKNVVTPDSHVELHGTPVITPDGTQVFIEMQQKDLKTDRYHKTIMIIRYRDGAWQPMETAPFSGTHDDGTITLSPDGKRLYFSSDRRVPGHPDRTGRDLWVVHRTDTGWSDATHLDGPINSDRIEGRIVLAGDNHAWFYRRFEADDGSGDIMECRFIDGTFTEPERLSGTINSSSFDVPGLASDDGSWLIFYSNRDFPDKAGIYITFRDTNGNWQKPEFLPPEINGCGLTFSTSLSPDGQYLFFLNRLTHEDRLPRNPGERPEGIYWMPFPPLLEHLKSSVSCSD